MLLLKQPLVESFTSIYKNLDFLLVLFILLTWQLEAVMQGKTTLGSTWIFEINVAKFAKFDEQSLVDKFTVEAFETL